MGSEQVSDREVDASASSSRRVCAADGRFKQEAGHSSSLGRMSLEIFQTIHISADNLVDVLDPCEAGFGVSC